MTRMAVNTEAALTRYLAVFWTCSSIPSQLLLAPTLTGGYSCYVSRR